MRDVFFFQYPWDNESGKTFEQRVKSTYRVQLCLGPQPNVDVSRFLVIWNLKIAVHSAFIFSKLFVRHSSEENRQNEEKQFIKCVDVNIYSLDETGVRKA